MKIVIVGGGNAGWLSALMLSKIASHHDYTLISSREISPIGVGEGTTGKFLDVINRPIMGIDFDEMFSSIEALPKLGVKFENWSKHGDYYSPLEGTISKNYYYIDYATYVAELLQQRHLASMSSIVMKNSLSNYRKNSGKLEQFLVSSALHLNTFLTTDYLQKKCIESGVKHIRETVKNVKTNGKIINSIHLSDGQIITADLFIDCTGFSRVLCKHLTNWESFEHYLPVNSAVTFKLNKQTIKNPYTKATAMKYGWIWEIPTQKNIGRGYVYCDKYANEEDIINEIELFYQCEVEKIKKLQFVSGKSSQFLVGNCLAIGLSAAFLEPLQATSLHCTLEQIDEFLYTFLHNTGQLYHEESVKEYNEKCHRLYDTTRDFVFLHYTGGKTDTEFWKYFINCKKPPTVERILSFAHSRLTRSFDFEFCNFSGGTASLWNPTIAGLGHFSKDLIETVLSNDHVCVEDYEIFLKNNEKQILHSLDKFDPNTLN